MEHHPDRNPDPSSQEKFKAISEAYSVLSDTQKRQVYDQFGEDGLNGFSGGSGPMGGMSAEDIFAQMFGGGFPGADNPFQGFGRQMEKRTQDIDHVIHVTLEDLYNGKSIPIEYIRNIKCTTCHGSGAKPPHKPQKCNICHGSGQRVVTRQMGGMIQQTIGECNACRGEGETIPSAHRCPECNGAKIMSRHTRQVVNVPRGAQSGEAIVFPGESHQHPSATSGDLRVWLEVTPHPTFKRIKNDLLFEQTLSLTNALSGYECQIKTLDGRLLILREVSGSGKIVKPGAIKMISGEGMPSRTTGGHGNLYIRFKIDFPDVPMVPADSVKDVTRLLKQINYIPSPEKANDVPPGAIRVTAIDMPPNTILDEGINTEKNTSGKRKRSRNSNSDQGQQCAQM